MKIKKYRIENKKKIKEQKKDQNLDQDLIIKKENIHHLNLHQDIDLEKEEEGGINIVKDPGQDLPHLLTMKENVKDTLKEKNLNGKED